MDKITDLSYEEFKAEYPSLDSGDNPVPVDSEGGSGYRPVIVSAVDLLAKNFPEPKYAVNGLLPEGLTVLVGQPKIGKSWFVLGVAVAVASGGNTLGNIPVSQGDALYLALEDGERRLQTRLGGVLHGSSIPERLSLATEWRHINEGGLDDIETWLNNHPEARIVIIDTLQRVRPPENGSRRLYANDYDAIAPLSDLGKRHGVAIVVVHHTRKQDSDDPVDLVSGSTGLTGAADGVCILRRSRGQTDAEMFATGRDFPEKSLALKWDNATLQWINIGDASDFRISQERREVKEAIRKLGGKATPKAIAEALGKKDGNVRKMLFEMKGDGQLISDARHNYYVGNIFSNDSNTSNGDIKIQLLDNSLDVTGVTDVIVNLDDSANECDDKAWHDDNLPF